MPARLSAGILAAVLTSWVLASLIAVQAPPSGLGAVNLFASPGGGAPSLSAAAAASGRPRECGAGGHRGARKPSIWALAREPNLQTYCDLVARAHAQLATDPAAAKDAAVQADKALPGHAAPLVIQARALLAQGKLDDAARAFEQARTLDPRSVEDPSTMHDLAQVLRKTGKLPEALAVYRALVPRIDLLGTGERRIAVLLEAAHVSMAVEAAHAASPEAAAKADARPRLDEAAAYLREARQRPPTALSGDVILSLVLVLDRKGERVEADAALGDALRSGVRLRAGTLDYLAASEDRACLEALTSDGPAAVKLWEGYLAGSGGKGPWAAAARARLEAARKAPAKPKGGAP
jgi:tetratricopeptide (TPR) repeat protein